MDPNVDFKTETAHLMKVGYLKYNGLLDSIIINNGFACEFDGELRITLTAQVIFHLFKALKIDSSMSDTKIAAKLNKDIIFSRFLIESAFLKYFPNAPIVYDELSARKNEWEIIRAKS